MKTVSINNQSLDPLTYSVPCGKMPALFIGDSIVVSLPNGESLEVSHERLTVFEY